MAFTASEEALVRQLLDQQAAILSLAGNEATITSKLGATKVTLADLAAASSLADADLLLARQGTTDKSVRADTLAAYMEAELDQTFAKIASPTFTGDPKAPTPAQFDNDTSLATTAFVKAFGLSASGQTVLSSSQTLPASSVGKFFVLAGTSSFTITLPLSGSVPSGSVLSFTNTNTTPITFNRQGAENIVFSNAGVVQTFNIQPGDTCVLVANGGTTWMQIAGSTGLSYSGLFGSSLAVSGYQKLPSGLIIQWGASTVAASSHLIAALPVAFPNSFYRVVGASETLDATASSTPFVGAAPNGLSQVRLQNAYSESSLRVAYIAIGR